jgi:hypothetical protein
VSLPSDPHRRYLARHHAHGYARMNGHDPHACLKDVLMRLPTHRANEIEQLMPHVWKSF